MKISKLPIFLLAFAIAFTFSGSTVFAQSSDTSRVIVTFREHPTLAERDLITTTGGRVHRSFRTTPSISAELTDKEIAELKKDHRVVSVEPDVEVFAIDTELDNTWGVKKIGAGDTQTLATGKDVKVAVIDTGIDYNHPDLAGNYAGGYDFVNDDTNPMDDNGHGTHVAGTIAALKNASGVVGVAPEAKLYALKVLNKSGSGYMSDIIAALDWAVENNVKVANLSLGTLSNPGTAVEDAFKNAYANGVISIAAAGNSGNCSGTGSNVNYPAKFSTVVAVSAVSQSDTRPCFSSTGSEVLLTAPGVIIKSTKMGGGYTELSGTSMASPHVAGTAALLISAGIKDSNGDGKVNDEIKNILTSTAADLGATGKDNLYGYGLVNALGAVNSVLGTITPPPTPIPDTSVKVSSISYTPSGRSLNIAVKVTTASGTPLSGASVSVTIRRDSSTWSGVGSTNSSGVVTFSLSNARSGCYTTSIKSVTKSGFVWDGINPDPGYCK